MSSNDISLRVRQMTEGWVWCKRCSTFLFKWQEIYSDEGGHYAAFSLPFPLLTFLSRHERLETVDGTEYFELRILSFHNIFYFWFKHTKRTGKKKSITLKMKWCLESLEIPCSWVIFNYLNSYSIGKKHNSRFGSYNWNSFSLNIVLTISNQPILLIVFA